MLSVESISKRFETRGGTLEVLRDVTLKLDRGESVAIMGPSGSGKSTLLNIIGTLDTPSSGSLTIDGCDPFSLSERELARFRNRRIGFVFQDHHLLPQCSVLENVCLPALADKANQDVSQRAAELLERVGLADRMDHRPAELSGGEKQRAAVARAVIHRPVLVLADEPTGNLDQASSETVADLLAELPRDEQAALVVVTHSESLAARFAQRFEFVLGTLTSTSRSAP